MLEAKNLTKSFDSKVAVNHISFTVKPGVITGLLGPNGAGKTTTMRLLTGFLEPSSGSVTYKGASISEDTIKIKSKLGYLPESAPLYPDMLVSEYLNYMADIRGISIENKENQISKMVDICDLSTHYNVTISYLSKGFKQRLALAGTLIHDPEIIILDEPTSGLDPNQITHIRGVIKNLGKEKIIILSTHILQEVEDICDEVIIINNGNIVANSSVKSLNAGNEVYISVNAQVDQVSKLFSSEQFIGVTKVPDENGKTFLPYIVSLKEDKPEIVFQILSKSGLQVREIKIYQKSLESVFEELTRN
jgi:ABC-2 type transport system ATP-binding protein